MVLPVVVDELSEQGPRKHEVTVCVRLGGYELDDVAQVLVVEVRDAWDRRGTQEFCGVTIRDDHVFHVGGSKP